MEWVYCWLTIVWRVRGAIVAEVKCDHICNEFLPVVSSVSGTVDDTDTCINTHYTCVHANFFFKLVLRNKRCESQIPQGLCILRITRVFLGMPPPIKILVFRENDPWPPFIKVSASKNHPSSYTFNRSPFWIKESVSVNKTINMDLKVVTLLMFGRYVS